MPELEGRSRPFQSMTVQECRDILGPSVADKSDEQVAKMLDDLEQLAVIMYDDVMRVARKDIEAVFWSVYAMENPKDAY